MNSDTLIAFDLDDTLYKEEDYCASGFNYVARRLSRRLRVPAESLIEAMTAGGDGRHPFDILHEAIDGRVSIDRMVRLYRDHIPFLILPDDTRQLLEQLSTEGFTLAIITDGRSRGQWNKIRALGLERFIPTRLISVSADIRAEKLSPLPWERIEALTPECRHRVYVGDNPAKDFMQPRSRGWHTVMLRDDGRNIHSQSPMPDDVCKHPHAVIEKLLQLPATISSLIATKE